MKGKQIWTFSYMQNNGRWPTRRSSVRPNRVKTHFVDEDRRVDLKNRWWLMTRRNLNGTGWLHHQFETRIMMFCTLESRRHWRRYENDTGSSVDEKKWRMFWRNGLKNVAICICFLFETHISTRKAVSKLARIPGLYFSFSPKRLKSCGRKINYARLYPTSIFVLTVKSWHKIMRDVFSHI